MCGESTIDWSQLPTDLLSKIAGILDDIADRIRFAAVCKPWRCASRSTQLPQIRLPWLLLPNNGEDDSDAQMRTFVSLSDNKPYTLHHPQFHNKLLYCSAHGWILAVDRSTATPTASLLNPITKSHISLPPLPTEAGFDRCKVIWSPRSSLVVMCALSTGPILCYRQLKGEWTEICAFDLNGRKQKARDFAYFRAHYCLLGQEDMTTSIVDADTRQVLSLIPPAARFCPWSCVKSVRRRYLVTSSSGEKLFHLIPSLQARSGEFGVFELNQSENKWFKVDDIGKDTLFVDAHHAMALQASTVFNRYRGNCIVLVMIARLRLVDIGSGRVEELLPYCGKNRFLWGSQGWFAPSL